MKHSPTPVGNVSAGCSVYYWLLTWRRSNGESTSRPSCTHPLTHQTSSSQVHLRHLRWWRRRWMSVWEATPCKAYYYRLLPVRDHHPRQHPHPAWRDETVYYYLLGCRTLSLRWARVCSSAEGQANSGGEEEEDSRGIKEMDRGMRPL